MRVDCNDDGSLDEVVGRGAFVHLEQMDDGLWFLLIEEEGREVRVFLQARGKIKTTVEDDKP